MPTLEELRAEVYRLERELEEARQNLVRSITHVNVTDGTVTRPLILGLDPGGTTGYAVVDGGGRVVRAGSFAWQDWATLEELLALPGLVAVVAERFALYGHKAGAMVGNEFEASQVLGATRLLLHQRGRVSDRSRTGHGQVAIVSESCEESHTSGAPGGATVDCQGAEGGAAPALWLQPASTIHDGARKLSPYTRRLVEAALAGAPGKTDRHARDALAHALVYLARQERRAA